MGEDGDSLGHAEIAFGEAQRVADHGGATAAVNEPAGLCAVLHSLVLIGHFDSAVVDLNIFYPRLLQNGGALPLRVLQEEMIEPGTLDLEGLRVARREAASKQDAAEAGGVAQGEFRAELWHEPGLLEFVPDAELAQDVVAVGDERFADVETGEDFALEHEYLLSGLREQARGGTPGRTAADDEGIPRVHLGED